jgi:mannose-6-phosphate isomerase-like protein (cupin superfamily)
VRLYILSVTIVILLCISAAPAQRPAKRFNAVTPNQVGAPDSHLKPIFENHRVRAMRVELGPQESTRSDPHRYDYLLISFGDSTFQLVGHNSIDVQLADGGMQLVPGRWPHKLVNTSSAPATLLMIELKDGAMAATAKCGLDKSPCKGSRFGRDLLGTYTQSTLFETEAVRLVRTELGPGGSVGEHTHAYDHVVIALTSLHLKLGSNEMTQPASSVAWQSGGIDGIWNIDKQEQRFLLLELK